MNIGLMGGTFDPVHLGHLAVAAEARLRFSLAKIIFVPAGQPYFKDISSITPARHRLNMLNLAIQRRPYYQISTLEIERSGPSFAVDTVAAMKTALDPADGLFFILGWDSLMSFPAWREPQRLMGLCRLVAAPRPGRNSLDLDLLEKSLPGISGRTLVMDKPWLDISSTQVRQRVRDGLPLTGLVPPAVARYIAENHLYQKQ
jgi:nicotinate-nucleotide adenylyltransferase